MAFKMGLAAIGLMMSSSIFAAVTISAPEDIVILAVNDQEVNAGILRTKKNEYKVDPGQVSLSVRYQGYFEHMDGEHDILKSGVVTVTAPNLIDGQKYNISLVGAPRNFDEAKKFAEQPTVAIFDQNNKLIVQQTGANNQAKPWFKSGVFGRVFDLTQDTKTPSNQPQAVYANQPQAAVVASATPAPVQTNAVQQHVSANSADQQMIEIWQKASKAERQRFMSWLANQ
ncbi:YccT family protein [Acinetobacter gerneri]|jgi:uncharacterized protein YccT (UPF0319 family)|uniref:YccT family protein n=1 Tax=Acinetobacter gerneri TaxID=202952 RepID=UPI0023F217FF|nr:DUF2057 domain-containing protein [Acinetobacter gerneri]MCH4245197.1 DUF2057 domain-containing protein [Acinetobacter gerneri]